MTTATTATHQVFVRPDDHASDFVHGVGEDGAWVPVHHGQPSKDGWLFYSIGRGFSGYAKPGDWR